MDFVDLQVFKSVVDEGGIIKAARKLHRVPSSVTTRVKQLEASLGVTLFHRDRQRLHLSPTGELLLAYAERLIQLSDEARAVVSGGMPQGALKLVFVSDEETGGDVGAHWLCTEHPDKVRCDMLLNEGGGEAFQYDGHRYYGVCCAEKTSTTSERAVRRPLSTSTCSRLRTSGSEPVASSSRMSFLPFAGIAGLSRSCVSSLLEAIASRIATRSGSIAAARAAESADSKKAVP